MDKKRKKIIQYLEGKHGEEPLQITEDKGEYHESDQDDESKGQEFVISKPQEHKRKKVLIVDPK